MSKIREIGNLLAKKIKDQIVKAVKNFFAVMITPIDDNNPYSEFNNLPYVDPDDGCNNVEERSIRLYTTNTTST